MPKKRPRPGRGHRTRQIVNIVTLATPLGLVAATCGRAQLSTGPHGLVLATSYALRFPAARAFTVGNVVITRSTRTALLDDAALLAHEARHATQYAVCLGVPMLPLYLLASAWSWLRCRDFATHNVFERMAGLADGGYETR